MITRRRFVVLTGSAILWSRIAPAADKVPTMLDHILFGFSDLDAGIAFVEQHTGVRAAIGGVHPGRGTRNALLSLGERRYLEIIAPDPQQSGVADPLPALLKALKSPRLVGWAAHVKDIGGFVGKLGQAGVKIAGPFPGSRKRPDGRLLEWKTAGFEDDRNGLLPFFIEWSAASTHPSVDAPSGCRLQSFVASGPDPAELAKTFQQLGLDVAVERAAKFSLRASIVGPKGTMEMTS